jgi:hypothetical protein
LLLLKLAAMTVAAATVAAIVAAVTGLPELLLALPTVSARQGLCISNTGSALAPPSPIPHRLPACAAPLQLLLLCLLWLLLLLPAVVLVLHIVCFQRPSRRLQEPILPPGTAAMAVAATAVAATAAAATVVAAMCRKALPMTAARRGLCLRRRNETALHPTLPALCCLQACTALLLQQWQHDGQQQQRSRQRLEVTAQVLLAVLTATASMASPQVLPVLLGRLLQQQGRQQQGWGLTGRSLAMT